jgi:hypothetical protein
MPLFTEIPRTAYVRLEVRLPLNNLSENRASNTFVSEPRGVGVVPLGSAAPAV